MNSILIALATLTRNVGPVVSSVLAAFLIIFGLLIIVKPALLGWIVGLVLILTGVAVLAGILTPSERNR
ncbi:MAG: hypothetical protein NPIRA04_23980 [Nitrospirales bacterium]|nr:MAG: hypothetical protein NPIRA04_23980 [Nitrospirales bacterium]